MSRPCVGKKSERLTEKEMLPCSQESYRIQEWLPGQKAYRECASPAQAGKTAFASLSKGYVSCYIAYPSPRQRGCSIQPLPKILMDMAFCCPGCLLLLFKNLFSPLRHVVIDWASLRVLRMLLNSLVKGFGRVQVIVVVLADWTVICLNHNLQTMWYTSVRVGLPSCCFADFASLARTIDQPKI